MEIIKRTFKSYTKGVWFRTTSGSGHETPGDVDTTDRERVAVSEKMFCLLGGQVDRLV